MSKTRRFHWPLAVIGTAVLSVLFGVQQWMAQTTARRDLDLGTALALAAITWCVWLIQLPLIIRVARRHPLAGRPRAGWVLRSLLEGSAFVISHSVIAGTLRWAVGLSVSSDFGTVMSNSLSVGFASNTLRYAAIFAAYQAVVYHDAVRERDQEAARLEVDLARAKLANVEACLRPHFLFNTLNVIAALVREDPRLAERTIGDLSDLLRASFAAEPSTEVRLDDELAFAAKYLELERVRFQDRLRVNIDASDEARRALVPHLLLQPLVENAVRHGIAPLEEGGSIAVTAAREDGRLRLTVRDDGVGVTANGSEARSGIGLRGVRAALVTLYGDRHRLTLLPASPRGTIVEIDIPYRNLTA